MARGLSKSKLMSFLQCPKRLWLEAHRPELAPPPDAATRARLAEGAAVGEIARSLYGRDGGTLVSAESGLGAATERTRQLLGEESSKPLFEATFQREGLLIRTDVLARTPAGARLVEVKASASVKAEHLSDCAIQSWVLEASRVRPRSVAVAHVDTEFIYRGDGRYEGLLVEEDITESARALTAQVPVWLGRAKRTLVGEEPRVLIGAQCRVPYECPFVSHCWPATEFPLTDLPGVHRNLAAYVARGYRDLRDVPVEEISSPQQERVWAAVRSGRATLEAGAAAELAALPWPRHHLDFETVAFAVPIWAGTRPYQALPFQWSLHIELSPGDNPVHIECLELDDAPPMRAVAERLVAAVGPVGPVLCYSGFEARCLATLAEFCPDLAPRLFAIEARLIDLHALLKRYYCHPAMHGSWSLKAVLPTIAPEMDYARLEEIQDGGAAQRAFIEAIDPGTSASRREEIRTRLLRYCAHDTLATVRIARFLSA